MKEVPPEERTFEYYKAIITKNYNPTCETFSQKEFVALKKEIENGNKKAQQEFLRKTYLLALDQIANMFAKGQLEGSFEDSLQDAWEIVYCNKGIESMSHAKSVGRFKVFLKLYIKRFFDTKSRNDKLNNLDKNFENIERLENIEEEIQKENTSNEDAYEEVVNKDLRQDLNKTMRAIVKAKEEKVLRMVYGLDDKTPKSLQEVGTKYGVSRQYIKITESKALKKMNQAPNKESLKEYLH